MYLLWFELSVWRELKTSVCSFIYLALINAMAWETAEVKCWCIPQAEQFPCWKANSSLILLYWCSAIASSVLRFLIQKIEGESRQLQILLKSGVCLIKVYLLCAIAFFILLGIAQPMPCAMIFWDRYQWKVDYFIRKMACYVKNQY